MSNKNNVPEIRVNGFSDDWVKRSLNQVCSSFGYGLNASAIKYDGLNKYLRITDIDDESRLFDQENLTSPGVDLSSKDSYLLAKGDIVFARTGASVGKTYLYNEKDNRVYYAGFLIRARVNHDSDRHFVFQNTLTKEYQKFVTVTSQRSGQPGINATEYSEYELFTPLIDEQIAVGNYFQKLDTLINQHQQKHDKLSNLKKAMLEKMFPKAGESVPEIRFDGFSGDWEEKKLEDISEKVTEKNSARVYSETFTNSAEFGVISQRDYFEKNISNSSNIDGYYVVKPEVFVYNPRISTLAPCGPVNRNGLGRTGIMSPLYTVFVTKNVDTTFLEYFFKTKIWHSFMYLNGDTGARSDRFSIKDAVFFELPVLCPVISEQVKLGEYFKSLDELINRHSQQLTKLKNIKQACLDKMFV